MKVTVLMQPSISAKASGAICVWQDMPNGLGIACYPTDDTGQQLFEAGKPVTFVINPIFVKEQAGLTFTPVVENGGIGVKFKDSYVIRNTETGEEYKSHVLEYIKMRLSHTKFNWSDLESKGFTETGKWIIRLADPFTTINMKNLHDSTI